VTLIWRLLGKAVGFQFVFGEIISVGRFCITDIFLVGAPGAEIVIVPNRGPDVL